MRATNKRARSTKGWRRRAPKTKRERDALYTRCGAKAFLDPQRRKFPVMAKLGPCVPDCEGVRAAYARAKQYKYGKAAGKAKRLGVRAACRWAP
jgi:hypothetical protein